MYKKKIVVTADDFGLSEGINQGIEQAFKEGIVSCASLSANGNAFEGALKIAKNCTIDIGVHFTFLEEKPILSADNVGSIIDENRRFFSSLPRFIRRLYLNKKTILNIEKEAKAQIEKILDAGIKPSFFNSHQHVHMLPGLFEKLVLLAGKYNIKVLRVPCENIARINLHSNRHKFFLPLGIFFLNASSVHHRKILRIKGLKYADRSVGILENGHLNENVLLGILKRLRCGVTEIICHPGIFDQSMIDYKHWHYHWDDELAALLSTNIKKYIYENKIEIINFKSLSYL